MSRTFLCSLLLAPVCCLATAQEQHSHLDLAQALINLLSETEACLNTCRDKDSVQAALPRLEQLAGQARQLRQQQAALPDSTVQDDMAAAELAGDFTLLWRAIGQHIERLETSGLMSEDLRHILHVAPPSRQNTPSLPVKTQ